MLNVVAGVVLAVWAANFVATLVVGDYDGSAINGVFTVIMGAVLAIKGRQRGKNSAEDEDSQEDDHDRS